VRAWKIREWGSRGRGRGREAKGREEEGGDHDGVAQSVDNVERAGGEKKRKRKVARGRGNERVGIVQILRFTIGTNFQRGEHIEFSPGGAC
jgi:hypothetical protein